MMTFQNLISAVAPYRKAIIAALGAGLAALGAALTDSVVTPVEWVAVASALLGIGGVTYRVPNSGE